MAFPFAAVAAIAGPKLLEWGLNRFGGGSPGQGGFQLQQDALNNQMNLSNSLMNMGQEQFGQESPYRANVLTALQDRAGQETSAYTPTAPTMYNPFNNTYRVAPTHGPQGVPRGHEGFSGAPAYQQAQAPQERAMGGGQEMEVIPGSGAGGQMNVGQALEDQYRHEPSEGAYDVDQIENDLRIQSEEDALVEDRLDDIDITTDQDEVARRTADEGPGAVWREGDFDDPDDRLALRKAELLGWDDVTSGPMPKPLVIDTPDNIQAIYDEKWEDHVRNKYSTWDYETYPMGPDGDGMS
jgi:hypothetical protein